MNLRVSIGIMALAATALGVFAQSLAYLLHDHVIGAVAPVYFVTIFTILSVLLFLATLFKLYHAQIKGLLDKNAFLVMFPLLLTLAVVVSSWSVFVVAMWWG